MSIHLRWVKIRLAKHYARIFFTEMRYVGVHSAFSKALLKVKSFLRSNITIMDYGQNKIFPVYNDYLPDLEMQGKLQPNMVMIVSNTQIDQCITYRINQKISILNELGVPAKIFKPSEVGRIKSFLPFTSIIIIYRANIREDLFVLFRQTGSRLIFEFDDLVVGRDQVEQSGVRASLSEIQYSNLLKESTLLKETAMKCDEIIVSTEYLKERYSDKRLESELSKIPINVISNFLVKEESHAPVDKLIDFCYTSPSQCVAPELKMANDFLQKVDKKEKKYWKLLIVGNKMAYDFFVAKNYEFGLVEYVPYAEYSEYVSIIRSTKYVLIPISDMLFNQSKTAIRSFDALLAGAIPLVSAVGDYKSFLNVSEMSRLVVDNNDWKALAENLDMFDKEYNEIVSRAQNYIHDKFGLVEAKKVYKRVFIK